MAHILGLNSAEVKIRSDEYQVAIVRLESPHACLSWAPWNGGMKTNISIVVNRTLGSHDEYPDKPQGLSEWVRQDLMRLGLEPRTCVGLLTAVPQKALRAANQRDAATGLTVDVLCTLGLGNALAPGDRTLYNEELGSMRHEPGTINIILMLNRCLTECAFHELMSIVTQAKCAALLEHGRKSRISGNICLGTGTDCIAILAPQHGRTRLKYAGLHTKLAEVTAKAVIDSVNSALAAHTEHLRTAEQFSPRGL